MAWYQCADHFFEDAFTYAIHELTCPICGKTKQAKLFEGDLRELTLGKEERISTCSLEAQLFILEKSKEHYLAVLDSFERRSAGIRSLSDSDLSKEGALKHILNKIQDVKDSMSTLDACIVDVRKKEQNIHKQNATVRNQADKVYTEANSIAARSEKNKLYIGSRQFVSEHVKKNKNKQKRILDSNVWTWGLNMSWVEGGINAKAHFKIKVAGSDSANAFAKLPDAAIQWFQDNARDTKGKPPKPDIDERFLEMCRSDGRGSLLWYDRDGEDRPTWTALEICCLLRRGYHFDIQNKGDKQKLYLLPPA